jgi:peptide/nickel transport system substrate-binding protein
VRRALKYGLDRQEMVDKILQGHGTVGNDSPIGPANQYYHAEMVKLNLIQTSPSSICGISIARDIDFVISNAAFEGAADQLFPSVCIAYGININVVQEPADGYWSNVWMNKPFCASYWSMRD